LLLVTFSDPARTGRGAKQSILELDRAGGRNRTLHLLITIQSL
jgi:hypothetical protein